MKKIIIVVLFLTAIFVSIFSGYNTVAAELPATKKTYISDTIRTPFKDLQNLKIPKILLNNSTAKWGLIDVTQEPFFADPTGKKDSTKELQAAINYARDNQMVCYIPLGTYNISDTLVCVQNLYRRQNGIIGTARQFPCVIMGSYEQAGKRPLFVLAPNSKGFTNKKKSKYLFHFWSRNRKNIEKPQANTNFEQLFLNCNIKIGKGNFGAVAIRFRSAEGSCIYDVDIDTGDGLKGLEGGPGSAGVRANIKITGGEIGIDFKESQPSPLLLGVKLINQRGPAIIYGGGSGPLTILGSLISSQGNGPYIVNSVKKYQPFNGSLNIIDSIIEGPAKTAINIQRSIYLRNVFFKGAKIALCVKGHKPLSGRLNNYLQVKEAAYTMPSAPWKGYNFAQPNYINNKRSFGSYVKLGNEKPCDNLLTKHLYPAIPHWGKGANVKSAYGAKGDGITDDTKAIQDAINKNKIVFLPKGIYKVSKTLKLKEDTQLIGVGTNFSIIIAVLVLEFNNQKTQTPILLTPKQKKSSILLDGFSVSVPREAKDGTFGIHWRTGGQSCSRLFNVLLTPLVGKGSRKRSPHRNSPLIRFTGQAGGKWYGQYAEYKMLKPKYRHILIKNVKGPLNFYGYHAQYCISEVMTEVRNSQWINFYAVKGEGHVAIIGIYDSNHINIFGFGGNATPVGDRSVIEIENTPNFTMSQIICRPRLPGNSNKRGTGRDPRSWCEIRFKSKNKNWQKIRALDEPVIYKHGSSETEPLAKKGK